jgi:hypothetical protein
MVRGSKNGNFGALQPDFPWNTFAESLVLVLDEV